MILDIIIPQYKETIEEMDQLLSNLNHQIGVDFNEILVTIVNDCGTPLNAVDLLKYSNLKFQLLTTKENSGCGVARQVGIDNTSSPYIMFIDADDSLVGYTTIADILNKISKTKGKGVWVAKCYEELTNNRYIEMDTGTTWMHGKIYLREYIKKLGITFNSKLRIHEDSYFNALAMWGMDKWVKKINIPMYIWRYNNKSTVRTDSLMYVFKGNKDWMKQATLVSYSLLFSNREGSLEYIMNVLFNCYYTRMVDAIHNPKYEKYIEDIDEDFYEYYKLYGIVSEKMDVKVRDEIQKLKKKQLENRIGHITEVYSYEDYIKYVQHKFNVEA